MSTASPYRLDLAQYAAAEVRAEMARQRLSPKQVSERAGIPLSTLRRRINGSYPFSLDQLVAVADALGIGTSALVREGM